MVYTDGASSPHKGGPGGWAYVVVLDGAAIAQASGPVADEANHHRCELLAAIRALEDQPAGAPFEIVTDSRYVIGGANWGWRVATNLDLWEQLHAALGARIEHPHWRHILGHGKAVNAMDVHWNHVADRLAFAAKGRSWRQGSASWHSVSPFSSL